MKKILLLLTAVMVVMFYGCDSATTPVDAKCAKGKYNVETGISLVDNETVCKIVDNGGGGEVIPPESGGDNGSGEVTPPEGGGGDIILPPSDSSALNADGTIKDELIRPSKNYYYGRSLLEKPEEIRLYDAIMNGLFTFEENGSYGRPAPDKPIDMIDHKVYLFLKQLNIKVKVSDYLPVLQKVYRYVRQDDARLFYTGLSMRYNSDSQYYDKGEWYFDNVSSTVAAWVTRAHYATVLKKMQTRAGEILSYVKPSISEYEKIKVIHDEFLRTVSYSASDDANRSRLDGALIDGKALCEGYARTLTHLYQLAGIESVLVIGPALTSGTAGKPLPTDVWIPHAWTKVKYNGQWYNIDSTWNDARITDPDYDVYYLFFMMSDAEFVLTHKNTCETYGSNVCPPVSAQNSLPPPPKLPKRK